MAINLRRWVLGGVLLGWLTPSAVLAQSGAYHLTWDDFSSGFLVDTPGAKWSYFGSGSFTAWDGANFAYSGNPGGGALAQLHAPGDDLL